MTQKDIGTYYFSQNPELFEPQRYNTFQFVATGISNLLKPGATAEDANANLKDTQEILTLSVVKAWMPNVSIEPVTIRRGNMVMKAAGLPSYNDGQIVIRDFIGAQGVSILQAWQKLAFNIDDGLTQKLSNYKKDCYLLQYDVDFSKVVRQWLLKGCWVSSIQQDEFDVENGDAHSVTATIQYDYAKLLLPDEAE